MSTQLKGGFTTEHPRLDRIPQFDPRSRDFPLTAEVAPKPLRSYTWNYRGYDPKLNQGVEGACVGHGWGNDLACYPVPVPGVNNAFARDRIYKPAQYIDEWPGEDYDGTSVLAGAKVVKNQLGLINGYSWCFSLNDVLLALGYRGPVVLGVNWYENMFDTDSNGFIHVSGDAAGGHCILARGVNIKNKTVLLRNSWGPDWGINGGDCLMAWSDLERLLSEDGEGCVPTGRKLTT